MEFIEDTTKPVSKNNERDPKNPKVTVKQTGSLSSQCTKTHTCKSTAELDANTTLELVRPDHTTHLHQSRETKPKLAHTHTHTLTLTLALTLTHTRTFARVYFSRLSTQQTFHVQAHVVSVNNGLLHFVLVHTSLQYK
jgi:hypothetical protein